ncbi:hypothetical protein TNCV_2967651 [Trichonephila clavipes]|nr:hypothetical protein TNCV_2967651 [Trichonephila clavipes]
MGCRLEFFHCRSSTFPGSWYLFLVRRHGGGYQSPQPPGQPIGVNVHCTLHPIREQPLSSQPSQKTLKTHHPDEEHKPRLPDSIAQPITNMPLRRMENTTFAKPSIIDSHDMGLRTVYTPDAQKKTPIQVKLLTQEISTTTGSTNQLPATH